MRVARRGETIASLAGQYRTGEVSPVEVTRALLERIRDVDRHLNAYVTVDGDGALQDARAAERLLLQGRRRRQLSPLLGIPIAVKDSIDTRDLKTTAGSRLFEARVPRRDARCVARLRRAGAIVIGKTNLDEFGMGVTTQNSHFGGTANPHDTRREPGGSSGGSAAALAADLCVAALGADSAGSIRAAAAACGVVGLKPTNGRVSVRGVLPLTPTRDTVGPMAKTVEDTALLLKVIAGYDRLDAESIDMSVPDYWEDWKKGITGLRIGVLAEHVRSVDQPAIRENFSRSVEILGGSGVDIEEVDLPMLDEALRAGLVFLAEAQAVHRRWFPARASEYSPRTRQVFAKADKLSAADLAAAHMRRRAMVVRYRSIMQGFDGLVLPAVPITAPPIGQDTIMLDDRAVESIVAILRYLPLFNMIGFPALVAPNGFDSSGLPTSIQIVARPWEESVALRIAQVVSP